VAGHIAGIDGGSFDASAVLPDAELDSGDAAAPYTFSEGGAFISADGGKESVETLSDFVYVLLLPTLPRLQGTARCIQ
jgi:hypothetical protein